MRTNKQSDEHELAETRFPEREISKNSHENPQPTTSSAVGRDEKLVGAERFPRKGDED